MLGDIVSNTTKSNGAAGKTTSQPKAKAGGYGTSGFGESPSARPAVVIQQQSRKRPINAASPITKTVKTEPSLVKEVRPVSQSDTSSHQNQVTLPSSGKRVSKLPLILTVVGTIIFIGGVVSLFVYALGGQ